MIQVEWVDSWCLGGGWDPIAQHRKARPATCYSIGFEVARRKGRNGWITLASTISKAGNAGGVVTIPARAIIGRRRVKG